MPYKDPMPTVGGKVPTAMYARVRRILKARGGLSMQKWVNGMLEFYVPREEEALSLRRKRKGTPRRPLRELPPLEGPSDRGTGAANPDAIIVPGALRLDP
jgi:hypothetical protein